MNPLVRIPEPPAPDASGADEAAAAYEVELKAQEEERRQFRENVLLDFAAFDSSIIRMQLLMTSNEKERERYAAEKLRIQATAQAVRESTTELRVQLGEAQTTLALRKTYDELAEKITSNRLLRPREDQHANLTKLNAEIVELERESSEYAQTWTERREQFGRIVDEGMHLRRLIRDEKEEVERREGMEEREDSETRSLRGRSSGVATPHHEGEGATPLHPGTDGRDTTTIGLRVDRQSDPRAKSPLRTSTPSIDVDRSKVEEKEDADMAEDGEVSVELEDNATPAERLVTDEDVEGDEARVSVNGDSMDTT